ncbi:BON domain-containing protein [Pseudidiomarina halophila]|uniref:Osmotically-inducible protein Y n=1 Tax=Pseudidiomarina halophila TaxID=1449799 RepID=A0A432Y0Z9_9GAMM|nr:BON domain-containing protein [Pseudidiomarina halophila]RUO54617.1 transporter [Pseudidiomarina halophila]
MNTRNLFMVLFLCLSGLILTGCGASPQRESTGEYFDDSVITTKVKAAIFNHPDLAVSEINVETFKGVVQLSGFVSSTADMNTAIRLARDVTGVTSVKNSMRLK